MKTTGKPLPLGYTEVSPSWHVIRLTRVAFFARSRAAVEAKERRYWKRQERERQRRRRQALVQQEQAAALAFTDARRAAQC